MGTHECDLKRLRQRMRVGGIEGEKERMMIERVMRERERERETERVQRRLRVNKLRQNVLRDQYSHSTYH